MCENGKCCTVGSATADRKLPCFLTNNFLRRLFSPPGRFVGAYVRRGNRAVDLGCGAGFHTLAMARIIGANGHLYAVDFDPVAIARLRQRARRRRLDGTIDPRTTSAADIGFIEDGSIDFVLAEGLLCCMTDHAGAVSQIRRVLRPEGRAYLSVIKAARTGDPRGVSSREWAELLAGFRLLNAGETLFTRWAVVGPPR